MYACRYLCICVQVQVCAWKVPSPSPSLPPLPPKSGIPSSFSSAFFSKMCTLDCMRTHHHIIIHTIIGIVSARVYISNNQIIFKIPNNPSNPHYTYIRDHIYTHTYKNAPFVVHAAASCACGPAVESLCPSGLEAF